MNKDEGRQLVGISALRFLQCFDTVGWVTGRTSEKPVSLSPKLLFWIRWRKKTEGGTG